MAFIAESHSINESIELVELAARSTFINRSVGLFYLDDAVHGISPWKRSEALSERRPGQMARLLQEKRCKQCDEQSNAKQEERVAEGHDVGLLAQLECDSDDGLVRGNGLIADTVAHEVGGKLCDAIARCFLKDA